jgi:hypothetical protein
MSVIGRLDNQVEEVLIAPIARRHEQKKREQEQENQAQTKEDSQTAPEKEPSESE